MSTLCAFWLPILAAAVAVFLVSFILHTVLPWHKSDYKGLPQETGILDALRPFNISPGDYMFPKCEQMSDLKTPEMLAKYNNGPAGVVTIHPKGPMTIGKSLVQWFVYLVVVNYVAANIAIHSLPPIPGHHQAFHTIALSTFLGFGGALCQMSIWYRRSWLTTIKSTIDALIYGVVTGVVFVWLWPHP